MADDASFYRNRAAIERANAEAATLDNVRDRCTRAMQSWDAMAARAERTVAMRHAREARASDALMDTGDARVMIG